MATVTRPNGTTTIVRNLGWLLRHASEVDSIDIAPAPADSLMGDALMRARLVDGTVYETVWADRSVMADWLARPRFAATRVYWFGQPEWGATVASLHTYSRDARKHGLPNVYGPTRPGMQFAGGVHVRRIF